MDAANVVYVTLYHLVHTQQSLRMVEVRLLTMSERTCAHDT